MIISELIDFVFKLLYLIQKYLCILIDFVEKVFFVLSGIDEINVDGKTNDLLSYIALSTDINKSFYMVLLIGVIMLFVFTIIAIIKSEAEDKKVAKSEIIFKALKGFILIVIMPFIFVAFIELSTSLLTALFNATSPSFIDHNVISKISTEIFITSASNAYIGDENIKELIVSKFMIGELSFYDLETVKTYYKMEDINFVVGIISSFVILALFSMCIIQLIQRIFDVILLYLISPVIIGTMPLNDEFHFKQYKNALISKMLMCYGIIISLNLYYLIVPLINDITFFESSFEDGLMHLLFIIGGAYAVTKSNAVINRIIDYQDDRRMYRDALNPLKQISHISRTTILDTTRLYRDISSFREKNKKSEKERK